MWAQGLTIGVLITASILTQSQRKKAVEEHVSVCILDPARLDSSAMTGTSRSFMGYCGGYSIYQTCVIYNLPSSLVSRAGEGEKGGSGTRLLILILSFVEWL
jgi:hypothetical protein